METQKIRDIVCQNTGANVSLETFTTIGDFLMLWSLFESKHFINPHNVAKTDCNERTIAKWVRKEDVNRNNVDSAYLYFQQRYTNPIDGKERYDSLNINNGYKAVILKTFKNEADSEGKLLSVFIILYQLRNNLFHGTKHIAEWNLNKENFDIANRVLLPFVS